MQSESAGFVLGFYFGSGVDIAKAFRLSFEDAVAMLRGRREIPEAHLEKLLIEKQSDMDTFRFLCSYVESLS